MDIQKSVGQGAINDPDDVRAVQKRLKELGFGFFGRVDGRFSTGLVLSIRLFQSIIAGRNTIKGDGRVDVGGRTQRYLAANNAPQWELMPLQGTGFVNRERQDTNDMHDFGTDWMAQTIVGAGQVYQAQYLVANPGKSLMTINDVSLPEGGDTPDHQGHETGLACDIYLPRKNGQSGGITWSSRSFDRAAAREMLTALRAQPLISGIFFNDPTLIQEGLCSQLGGHDNHIHFNISPPPAN